MPVGGGTSDTWQLIPSPCTNDNCCTPRRESIRFLINDKSKLNGLQKPDILINPSENSKIPKYHKKQTFNHPFNLHPEK